MTFVAIWVRLLEEVKFLKREALAGDWISVFRYIQETKGHTFQWKSSEPPKEENRDYKKVKLKTTSFFDKIYLRICSSETNHQIKAYVDSWNLHVSTIYSLWRGYCNTLCVFLDIIQQPVFYLNISSWRLDSVSERDGTSSNDWSQMSRILYDDGAMQSAKRSVLHKKQDDG